MINFNFFNNLIDFIDELFELLKEDWKKFKLFAKENKKNLIWLFIALITLQFTDLIHIGNSCNKYYKNENIKLQKGGSVAPPPLPLPRVDRSKKPGAGAPAAATAPAAPVAPTTAAPEAEKSKGKGKEVDSESKDVQKKLDLFNELKGKKNKLAKDGLAGPIFSNLEGIFGAVGGIFSLLVTILTILGILYLPVLIFIIITYCVIKKVLGHLALV